MTLVDQQLSDTTERETATAPGAGSPLLDGEQVLLCASLFYFRIPKELWAQRLEQLRSSGYQAIDVYLPWNFHELEPGVWDFTGRRDVATFLDVAAETGLLVVARPGPYICSEWDGGALPAWLGLDPEMELRQASPTFLAAVRTWFDRALPILAARQHGRGGSVIAVQLENELDFFDTADRTAYQGALRDMAYAHGIEVPLIACAGQGDLAGATGGAAGVLPAFNFYPDDSSPFIEPEVRHYRHLTAARDVPLMVTETNRRHLTLRRLVASGAGLVAPYLQASGYNVGFTPSVGNWGDPAGLMTHDYDFHGFLSSVGEERAEYADARTLGALVRLLGRDLARAVPEAAEGAYRTAAPTSASPSRLRLAGGGSLIGVPNLGEDDASVDLAVGNEWLRAELPARTCLLVLTDLPLARWGSAGTLELATGDLVAASQHTLTFAATGRSVVALRAPDGARTALELDAPRAGAPVRARATAGDGAWEVVVLHPSDVPGPGAPDGRLVGGAPESPDGVARPSAFSHPGAASDGPLELGPLRQCEREALAHAASHAVAPQSEEVGVWRGRTHYRTALPSGDASVDQVLLEGAGDILDVTLRGEGEPRHVTLTPFGASTLLPVRGATELAVTAETWGHPNFDDARLPGLRLGSLRGLGRVWAVTDTRDVSALWTVEGGEQWSGEPAPVRTLGGWSSTRVGRPITYRRSLPVDDEHHHALQLTGVLGSLQVTLDGETHLVTQENPWLHLAPGRGRDLAITMPHQPDHARSAKLLRLAPLGPWDVAPEPDVTYIARVSHAVVIADEPLPLALAPGEERVVALDVPPGGWSLRFEGEQLRVAVVGDGELLGRVWLSDPARPIFTGGDPGRVWLPAAWNRGSIRLVLRGTPGAATPVLTSVRAEPTPQ